MSLFSISQPNDLRIRSQQIYGEEFFVKEVSTGDWIPLKPGGGGGDIPYYLEPTTIEMKTTTPTVKESTLESGQLSLKDAVGSAILDRSSIDATNLVKKMLIDPVVSNVDHKPVVMDSMGKMKQMDPLITKGVDNLTRIGQTLVEGIDGGKLRFSSAASSSVTLSSTHAAISKINVSTNFNNIIGTKLTGNIYSFDGTKPRSETTDIALTFHTDSSNRVTLNMDDVTVTNKLKALSSKVKDAGSKMLIYDAGTKAYNYTDIPTSGGMVPDYIKPTKIEMIDVDNDFRYSMDEEKGFKAISGYGTSYAMDLLNGIKATSGSGTTYSKLSHWGCLELGKPGFSGVTLYADELDTIKKNKAMRYMKCTMTASQFIGLHPDEYRLSKIYYPMAVTNGAFVYPNIASLPENTTLFIKIGTGNNGIDALEFNKPYGVRISNNGVVPSYTLSANQNISGAKYLTKSWKDVTISSFVVYDEVIPENASGVADPNRTIKAGTMIFMISSPFYGKTVDGGEGKFDGVITFTKHYTNSYDSLIPIYTPGS